MKKRFAFFIAIIFLLLQGYSFAAENSLTQDELVDIITISPLSNYLKTMSENKSSFSTEVAGATQKYEQSNTVVSYKDFSNIINQKGNNDFKYLGLAYKMSSLGFFSLAQSSLLKVEDEGTWQIQIKAIKNTYFPDYTLNFDEEIYLAEKTADILYNNLIQETTKELSKNSKLIKKSDYANYVLALGYLKQKEYSRSINSINKAISISPDTLNYQKFKAEVLVANSQYSDALKLIKHLENQNNFAIAFNDNLNSLKFFAMYKQKERSIKGKYNYANYLYLNRDFRKANKVLSQIPVKKQKNPEILTLMAKNDFALNDDKKASENYMKVININHKYTPALLGLGDIHLKAGDTSEALYFYEKALKNDKFSSEVLLKLANCYCERKEFEKALQFVNQALAIDGQNSEGYYIKSKIDLKNQDELLKKSLSLSVTNYNAWFDLAKTNIEKNDLNSANEYLISAKLLVPNDYRAFYFQYLLDIKSGNIQEAQLNLAKAFELNKELKQKIQKDDKL